MRQAFEQHYHRNRIARKTDDQFRYCLNAWERCTDNPPIGSITPATVEAFRSALDGLAPYTVERMVDRVLTILRRCERQGLIDRAPHAGDRLKVPDPIPRVVSLESLSAMYLACDVATWPNYRQRVRGESGRAKGGWFQWKPCPWAGDFWRCFLCVGFLTGLRLSDLLKLRKGDFSGYVLAVVAGKTGKRQSIPIHPTLARHVENAVWCNQSGLLFPVGESFKQFRRELAAICTAAGVESVTPQDLRVCSANAWEDARDGAGPAILGHSLIRGASRFYLRPPRLLEEALPRLRVPSAFLTDDERQAGASRIAELLARFERMDGESQELLLGMARRIG